MGRGRKELVASAHCRLGYGACGLLALQQPGTLRLGPPALAHIAGDDGGAADTPLRISDWRYGDGHVQQAAVLVPPHRLIVLDALAAPESRQDVA
jgi:hypothetical protein